MQRMRSSPETYFPFKRLSGETLKAFFNGKLSAFATCLTFCSTLRAGVHVGGAPRRPLGWRQGPCPPSSGPRVGMRGNPEPGTFERRSTGSTGNVRTRQS